MSQNFISAKDAREVEAIFKRQTIRLCVDCAHYARHVIGGSDYSKCGHPAVASRVNGAAINYCQCERHSGGCGPDALRFELRPALKPLLARFLGWFRP